MAISGGTEDGEPMMDMNTTPLIDVMLVLLIMFIITIPVQTHAVKVDLPIDSNATPPPVDPVKNKITIDATGVIAWNAQPVNEAQLVQYLDASKQIEPEPELQFEPHPQARYDVVDQTLATIKRANVTKLGFVGNERYYRDF